MKEGCCTSESPDEIRAEAVRWLEYADADLATAEALEGLPAIPSRIACEHAQQAAEKALKAALVSHSIDFPRTHNLNVLRNLLPTASPLRSQLPDLAELTHWAIEARYPGDWPEATERDASNALDQARAVVEAATRVLR